MSERQAVAQALKQISDFDIMRCDCVEQSDREFEKVMTEFIQHWEFACFPEIKDLVDRARSGINSIRLRRAECHR